MFDTGTYHELLEVPDAHRRYLDEQRSQDADALGFVFVPHVLVDGPIDIGGLPLLPM